MIKIACCIAIVLVSLTSCGNKFGFRDVSSFRIDTAALKENELVEVIYVSGGPDYNAKNEYFFHYIVVSQTTGDTVNLLTPFLMPNLSEDNRIYNFIPYHSGSGKLVMNSMVASIGGDTGTLPPVESMVLPQINKVVVNPKFDAIENNRFPAVMGFLGTVTAPPASN